VSPDSGKVKASRVYDLARNAAIRDLKDLHPEQWQVLVDGWVEHYRKELGWEDLRPETNRARGQQER
jgi:hypothetical protein